MLMVDESAGLRGAHYLAVYGRRRPAETLVRTAVSARFMVRMGSPGSIPAGAPHQTSSSGRGVTPDLSPPREPLDAVCQRFASSICTPCVVVAPAVAARRSRVATGLAGGGAPA